MSGAATRIRTRINSLIQARSRNTFSRFLIDNSNFMSKSYNEALRKVGRNKDVYLTLTELFVGMLRSVTAVSYLYFPVIWFFELEASHFGGEIPFATLTMWMVVEIVFFLLYYHQYVRFNDQRPRLKHRAQTRDQRISMLRTCFAAMSDGSEDQSPKGVVEHLRKTMEGWFLNVPLNEVLYNNVAQWTAFAFFSKELEDMSIDEIRDNREIVRILETDYLDFKFKPGYNPDSPAMRLNFDPLVVTQRPFIVYLFFYIVNYVTSTVLHFLLGFSLRKTHCRSGVMLYHRSVDIVQPDDRDRSDTSFFEHVLSMFDNSSLSPEISFQYPDGAGPEAEDTKAPLKNSDVYPIVFIHGLGIGFAHYIYLIAGLPRDRDVYLVEMPYVCMRLDAVAPNMADTVAAIVEILTADGYCGSDTPEVVSDSYDVAPRYLQTSDDEEPESTATIPAPASVISSRKSEKVLGACFVAHSLGTCVVSWMLHHKKTRPLVATTVLIDPVTFLLCMPKVCASFVHPDPKCVSTYLSSFMLAKELYIANALSRHFNWSHNAVFLENLPGAWEEEIFNEHQNDRGKPKFQIIADEFEERKLRTTIILSKHDHIVPLENVSWYLQKRAQGIFERTYGSFSDKEQRPEKPKCNVVRNDARIDMLDYCTTKVKDAAKPALIPASPPRPPAAVFRGRNESLDEDVTLKTLEKRYHFGTDHDSETVIPLPACWFEWTIFDCAHGEQMMVPKFLQIILDKIMERSKCLK